MIVRLPNDLVPGAIELAAQRIRARPECPSPDPC
jgi:hypothetical protein